MERRGTILIVEDEPVLRMLVAQFLRNEGYLVQEAEDGGEGVRQYLDEGPFDLLLVDLKMPVLSGVEVCRRVKQARPEQPIMVCSAAISRDQADDLQAVGVEHQMTKPYHPESLLAFVRQILSRRPATSRGLIAASVPS